MTSVRLHPLPAVVAVLLAAAAAAGAMAASSGTRHTVVMEAVKYAPAILTVRQGDTVTWVNRDPYPHNVTAKDAFQSREIGAEGKWTHVAAKPGRYDYLCTLHPGMKGTLVVEKR